MEIPTEEVIAYTHSATAAEISEMKSAVFICPKTSKAIQPQAPQYQNQNSERGNQLCQNFKISTTKSKRHKEKSAKKKTASKNLLLNKKPRKRKREIIACVSDMDCLKVCYPCQHKIIMNFYWGYLA